jgi:hypothetical protein
LCSAEKERYGTHKEMFDHKGVNLSKNGSEKSFFFSRATQKSGGMVHLSTYSGDFYHFVSTIFLKQRHASFYFHKW